MTRKQWAMSGTALIRAMDPEPLAQIPASAFWRSNREKRFFEYQLAQRPLTP